MEIGTKLMYPPINKQLAYKIIGKDPISNNIGLKGLWLPSAVQINNVDIDYICLEIKEFYSRYSKI